MKKVLSLFLVVFICFTAITGCQNTTPEEPVDTKEIKITYNTFGEFDGAEYQIIDGELYGRYRNSLGLFGEDEATYCKEWTKTSIDADNIIHLEVVSGIILYLTRDGKVYALGYADENFLEKWSYKGETYFEPVTTPVLLFEDCKIASLGIRFVLFLKNDNTLWFMGESLNGQSTQVKEVISEPIKIADNIQFAKAFSYTSAWIDSEYNLYLCGDNSYGQIGNGIMGCGYPTKFQDIVEAPFCALKGCISFSTEEGYNNIWSVQAETANGEVYVWGGEYGATPVCADD